MKRLFLIISCLFLLISHSDAMMLIGGQTLASSLTCTSLIDTSTESVNSYPSVSLTAADNYQQIKAQGASFTVCQVDVYLSCATSDGTSHIEFWNTAGDTKYGDSSDSVSIVSAGGALYTFTWSGTAPTIPNADVHMRIIREGTLIRFGLGANDTLYENTSYSAFSYGTDKDKDAIFKIWSLQ